LLYLLWGSDQRPLERNGPFAPRSDHIVSLVCGFPGSPHREQTAMIVAVGASADRHKATWLGNGAVNLAPVDGFDTGANGRTRTDPKRTLLCTPADSSVPNGPISTPFWRRVPEIIERWVNRAAYAGKSGRLQSKGWAHDVARSVPILCTRSFLPLLPYSTTPDVLHEHFFHRSVLICHTWAEVKKIQRRKERSCYNETPRGCL
jgi:hypothetical protein